MKKLILIFGILLTILVGALEVYACQPCAKTLGFEQTVNKAELIIVGQKVGEGPASDFGEGYGGPEWIEVKIKKVLKGIVNESRIKVNSWDGMCSYGIIIHDGNDYLMLLQKREVTHEDYQYDAVDFGCAEKSFLVENNMFDLYGESITLDDLTSRSGSQPTKLYYIIPIIILLIIVILIIFKNIKK